MKMSDFDYKKHSLQQLETWVRDALVSAEVSPQEIYDTIKGVVDEEYHYFKHHTGRCYDLLALLNGNGKGHISAYDEYVEKKENLVCDKDNPSPECKKSWTSFWEEHKEDKVVKWQLPIEIDDTSGEYFVSFPDDLLEAVNLKEGDKVEWVDQGDGSYLIKKVN